MDTSEKTKRMVLEWSRNAPEDLIAHAMGIDAKLIGILTTASAVLSIAAAIGVAIFANERELTLNCWSALAGLAFGVALISYIVIVGIILLKVDKKDYSRSNAPDTEAKGKDEYWNQNPEDLVNFEWKTVKLAYKKNLAISNDKADGLRTSVILLAILTLALISGLVFALFS